jgi:ATP-dependent Clp protease ATP-binding subunit ClpB
MTSNAGSAAIAEFAGKDQSKAREHALEALRATFRPEFLNRVDEIVLFLPLGDRQLEKIVELQVQHVAKLLETRKITIELTPAAREALFREGYDPVYGARPLRRAIQRLVQDPLAMEILEGKILPGEHVVVDREAKTGALKFKHAPAVARAAS